MQDEKLNSVREWVNAWVEGGSYPGALVAVYDKQGREVLYHECSNAKSQEAEKYTRESIFRIYSMTKPVTAVAAMILVERGLISLDDEISKWIPAFAQATVFTGGTVDAPLTQPLIQAITIRHLLTHTSGIGYGIVVSSTCDQLLLQSFGCSLFETPNMELEELCNRIAKAPLNFQPGTGFVYGLNLDVLGRIIEIVSGVKLDEFFKQEIFVPLGMVDTDFFVPADKAHRLLPCYNMSTGHTYKPSDNPMNDCSSKPVGLHGGGGLVSTLHDYARFARCLLNEGSLDSKRILSAESVQDLTSNLLPDGKEISDLVKTPGFLEVEGGGFGFGGAMYVLTNPAQAQGARLSGKGEYGWGGFASTFFFVDPVKEFTVIFLTQLMPSSAYPTRGQLRWIIHWAMQP